MLCQAKILKPVLVVLDAAHAGIEKTSCAWTMGHLALLQWRECIATLSVHNERIALILLLLLWGRLGLPIALHWRCARP